MKHYSTNTDVKRAKILQRRLSLFHMIMIFRTGNTILKGLYDFHMELAQSVSVHEFSHSKCSVMIWLRCLAVMGHEICAPPDWKFPGENSWVPYLFVAALKTLTCRPCTFVSHNDVIKGNIFHVTGPLCGQFTSQHWIPRTKVTDTELWCFLDLRLNKRLSKQSWGCWSATTSHSLWRHCNVDGVTQWHTFVHRFFIPKGNIRNSSDCWQNM